MAAIVLRMLATRLPPDGCRALLQGGAAGALAEMLAAILETSQHLWRQMETAGNRQIGASRIASASLTGLSALYTKCCDIPRPGSALLANWPALRRRLLPLLPSRRLPELRAELEELIRGLSASVAAMGAMVAVGPEAAAEMMALAGLTFQPQDTAEAASAATDAAALPPNTAEVASTAAVAAALPHNTAGAASTAEVTAALPLATAEATSTAIVAAAVPMYMPRPEAVISDAASDAKKVPHMIHSWHNRSSAACQAAWQYHC